MLLLFQYTLKFCEAKVIACTCVIRCPVFLNAALSQALFSEHRPQLSGFLFIRVGLIYVMK